MDNVRVSMVARDLFGKIHDFLMVRPDHEKIFDFCKDTKNPKLASR